MIQPWLKDTSDYTPIAILSGYGMGKTSYAKYLACTLAKAHLIDRTEPIPVLIYLGHLVRSQSLRTLLSSVFSDTYPSSGYSYDLFDKLNKSGRFVIIFDAFDEMKHAMRRQDISFNLDEICEQIHSKTKAVLLGRPDPFIMDADFKLLDGKIQLGKNEIVDTSKMFFRKVSLSLFSVEENIFILSRIYEIPY